MKKPKVSTKKRPALSLEASRVYEIAHNNALAAGASAKGAMEVAWDAVGKGWVLTDGKWVRKEPPPQGDGAAE